VEQNHDFSTVKIASPLHSRNHFNGESRKEFKPRDKSLQCQNSATVAIFLGWSRLPVNSCLCTFYRKCSDALHFILRKNTQIKFRLRLRHSDTPFVKSRVRERVIQGKWKTNCVVQFSWNRGDKRHYSSEQLTHNIHDETSTQAEYILRTGEQERGVQKTKSVHLEKHKN